MPQVFPERSGPGVSGTTYAYDLSDRLTSITPAAGTAATFAMDALGRAKSRTTGTSVEAYGYAGTTETVVRLATTVNGTPTTTLDAVLGSDGSRLATSVTGGGSPGFGWLLPDLHGNVAAIRSATLAATTDAYRYDAYGVTVGTLDSGRPSPWRYQGRLLVDPAGAPDLYDAGARYYSPGIGAFTQLDSVTGSAQNPLSMNRYLYAEANPATLVDPTGHCTNNNPDCVTGSSAQAAKDNANYVSASSQRARAQATYRSQRIARQAKVDAKDDANYRVVKAKDKDRDVLGAALDMTRSVVGLEAAVFEGAVKKTEAGLRATYADDPYAGVLDQIKAQRERLDDAVMAWDGRWGVKGGYELFDPSAKETRIGSEMGGMAKALRGIFVAGLALEGLHVWDEYQSKGLVSAGGQAAAFGISLWVGTAAAAGCTAATGMVGLCAVGGGLVSLGTETGINGVVEFMKPYRDEVGMPSPTSELPHGLRFGGNVGNNAYLQHMQ